MDLPRSIYGLINKAFLSLKSIEKNSKREIIKNDCIFERLEKDMRYSEMVEVVE